MKTQSEVYKEQIDELLQAVRNFVQKTGIDNINVNLTYNENEYGMDIVGSISCDDRSEVYSCTLNFSIGS